MKTIAGLVCVSLGLLLCSCSKSSDSSESELINSPNPGSTNSTSELVTVDFVLDYDNNGNANDLVVRYSVNNSSNLTEVWLFIAPEANYSTINSTTLAELPSDRYESISIETTLTDISPSDLLLDTGGNQIRNGTKYKLGFATVKGSKISRELVNIPFELRDQHYLTGRYSGTWNDDMFSNVAFSLDISSTGNRLDGPGYFTTNFLPYYGGDDDGSITSTVAGEQLQNVIWDEFLTDYMGGCSGQWTGEGTIVDIVTIILRLSGENCLYSSSNVEIELSRTF